MRVSACAQVSVRKRILRVCAHLTCKVSRSMRSSSQSSEGIVSFCSASSSMSLSSVDLARASSSALMPNWPSLHSSVTATVIAPFQSCGRALTDSDTDLQQKTASQAASHEMEVKGGSALLERI